QTSSEAADLVTSLMFEVPHDEAPELTAELVELDAAVQQRQSRVARMSFVVILGFVVLAAINGLENWAFAAVIAVVSGALMALAWQLSLRPARAHEIVLTLVGNALLAALLSRMFGSIVIAPAVTCIMAVSLTSYPHLIARGRVVIALLVLSWIAPVILEQLGILATTWIVRDGLIESSSDLIRIGGAATTGLLIVGNVATIVTIGLFANTLARTRRDAQRQVTAQAWHLRQLLPLRQAPPIAPVRATRTRP
ncbi:MAG: hypothetical protein H0T79_08085, partial [Deltaproteobacteria bacterium]|nr:hypothetical protein [Deltaproteobacteria bacterium]